MIKEKFTIEILEKHLGHDKGSKRKIDAFIVGHEVIDKFGYEGFKAHLLHHALDYIASLLRSRKRITVSTISRRVTEIATPVVIRTYRLWRSGRGVSPFGTSREILNIQALYPRTSLQISQ